MSNKTTKHSYTIPCSTAFRDAVVDLAERRLVNVADLARSVLLVVAPTVLATFPDPGEPGREDRETVVLKSGPAKGRPWRRKPRLQVRMAPGQDIVTIRRALGLALTLDHGEVKVRVESAKASPEAEAADLKKVRDEAERLRSIVSVLTVDPLPRGVRTRAEALFVLGFPPDSQPASSSLRARFRVAATIHHPDSLYGNHQRMSQLNAAMELLRHELV